MKCFEFNELKTGKLKTNEGVSSLVDHLALMLPVELAHMTKGNIFLVRMWRRAGMPTINCRCQRIELDIVIPWLKERHFIDDQGNARRWIDARP